MSNVSEVSEDKEGSYIQMLNGNLSNKLNRVLSKFGNKVAIKKG